MHTPTSSPQSEASASREPAPCDLGLVQALLNTVDFELGSDDFTDPNTTGLWLVAAGLMEPPEAAGVGAPEFERIVAVREALRGVVQANSGGAVDPAAAELIEQESDRVGLRVRFGADGVGRLAACHGGVDGAVARLLSAVVAAGLDGTWRRLKACREHTCQWAFYDRSRNGSSCWCSMAVCGNRAKARRHRERQRPSPASA